MAENTVRQARYRLAKTLLAEGAVRVTEAVEQLDLAVNEFGSDPPAWQLLRLGARHIRDVTPADAVARYLRSLKQGAPDSTAHEARVWAESLRPGTLRLGGSATGSLLETPTTPARQLLAATLLRSVGDSERALAVVGAIAPEADVREPLAALDVHCLIDLGDYSAAERKLADPAYTSALSEHGATFLRARLAFERQDFAWALEFLQLLGNTPTDEISALRNLAYVGAGRAAEVQWPTLGADDPAGPETWLSRAVACLASNRYEQAQGAASQAERFLPESLSVLLLKAQALLEGDGLDRGLLDQGLAMLRLVVSGSRERRRGPFWLERQRIVRSSARFDYVQCEYDHLKGLFDVARIRAVDQARTTYYQDGRLAEIEADGYGSGPDWAAALDRSVTAYTTANAYADALPLAEQVFRAVPNFARALAFGWAVYGWAFPDDNGVSAADPPVQAERLGEAIAVLAEYLPQTSDHDLPESLRLTTAIKARQAELLEHGTIAVAREASRWAFAGAVIAAADPWPQLILEWLVREGFDLEIAAFDIAEYAASLDPSLPKTLETRLIARTNLFGVDKETYELLAEIGRHAADGSADGPTAQWCHGVELRLAALDGNLTRARQLLDADMGQYPWALELRALAKIRLDGIGAAAAELAQVLQALRGTPDTKLRLARMAALSGQHDEAAALVAAATGEGNDLVTDIDYTNVILRAARHRDHPLREYAAELIAQTRTRANLLWLEQLLFPALRQLRGDPADDEPDAIGDLIAQRHADLAADPRAWTAELAREDAVLGSLASLWRAGIQHDLPVMAAALRQLETAEVPGSFGAILAAVCRAARARLAAEALAEAVAAVAREEQPARDRLAPVLDGMTAPSASLARALAGVSDLDDQPSADDLAAGAAALAEATRRCADSPGAVWRVYDAAGTLPGKFAEVWHPALRDELLSLLGTMAGLAATPDYEYRSHLSFVLGGDFIPEDTSERWILLSEYIPRLRERIQAATGYFVLPGFNIRGDRSGGARDNLHLLIHDVIFERHDSLPTSGSVVRCGDGVQPPGQTALTDPLTGAPVWHVAPAEPEPAGVVERWQPLEFVMRYVERFVRDHLADIITVRDVIDLAGYAGPEAAAELSDPACLLRWLTEARREIRKGSPLGSRVAISHAIAERVRQGAAAAGAAAAAPAMAAESRSRP